MVPSKLECQKSSLILNQNATLLSMSPASFFVHYWGGKPDHLGNTPHAHSFFEICYVADGEGTYILNGVRYPLQRGTLYCSKPGNSHQIQSDSGIMLLFVAFEVVKESSSVECNQIFEKLLKFHHLFIPEAEGSAAVQIWKSLINCASDETILYPEVLTRLAHCFLMTALALFYKQGGFVTSDHSVSPPHSRTIKEAKDYIMAHLAEKLTKKDLAHVLHLSERQFSRLLSEQIGQSFPAWVRNERIKRSAYLLAYTDMSMEEISIEIGFETIHYFNRVFGEIMNITPGKFRKAAQEKELEVPILHRYLQTALNRHHD